MKERKPWYITEEDLSDIQDAVMFFIQNAPDKEMYYIPDFDEIPDMRYDVYKFALKMEEKLKKNDEKGGWLDCDLYYLEQRIFGELEEFLEAYHQDDVEALEKEAADVANFLMMFVDVFRMKHHVDCEECLYLSESSEDTYPNGVAARYCSRKDKERLKQQVEGCCYGKKKVTEDV